MPRSDITIERRFDVTNNITEDWFRCYVSELEKYGGDYRDYVNCDVRLGSDFENRVAFRNRQTWTDYVWNIGLTSQKLAYGKSSVRALRNALFGKACAITGATTCF